MGNKRKKNSRTETSLAIRKKKNTRKGNKNARANKKDTKMKLKYKHPKLALALKILLVVLIIAIVIGAGIVGNATAYYLAKKGKSVIVLEASDYIGNGGSSRNGGGVRQSGRNVKELPLSLYFLLLLPSENISKL